MINVSMYEDGFLVDGHAGYADEGSDIICAAVSTIVQLAQFGLRQLADQYPEYISIRYEIGGLGSK